MAITSLLCSFAVLFALIVIPPEGWHSALVEASSRPDSLSTLEALGYRNVDPSMLKATAAASQTLQQTIEPSTAGQASSDQTAAKDQATSTTPPAGLLVEGDNEEQSSDTIEKRRLAEEQRQWEEHLAATVRKQPRRSQSETGGKHKRRPGVVLDPRKTWQAFLRHTERQQEREKLRNKKVAAHKRVKAAHLRMRAQDDEVIELPSRAEATPFIGGMSRQQMIEHMRDLIKEAAERRLAQRISMCGGNLTAVECTDSMNTPGSVAGSPLFDFERAALIPEMQSAFTWKLRSALKVRRQREAELRAFYRPYVSGAFERGDGLRADQGRFTAPAEGVYVFNAQVHFNVTSAANSRGGQPDGSVTLKLCINSNCSANFVLSAMRSISTSGSFTLSIGGPIHLKAGQSVSLFVFNKARAAVLRVLEESTFSGYMTSYL